jgi:hypothetical protein
MICQDRLGTSARETAPQNRTHAKRRRFPHREAEHCRNEEQHCRCIDLVHLVLRCHDGKARPEKSQKPRAHRRAVIHRHPRAVALHLPAKNVEDAHREGGGPREPVEPQHHSEDGAAVETCAGREETAPWFLGVPDACPEPVLANDRISKKLADKKSCVLLCLTVEAHGGSLRIGLQRVAIRRVGARAGGRAGGRAALVVSRDIEQLHARTARQAGRDRGLSGNGSTTRVATV